MAIEEVIAAAAGDQKTQDSKRLLGGLIQKPQYVGEVFSVGYEEAVVIIHDAYRERVGGIPSLSFLVATRIEPNAETLGQRSDHGRLHSQPDFLRGRPLPHYWNFLFG